MSQQMFEIARRTRSSYLDLAFNYTEPITAVADKIFSNRADRPFVDCVFPGHESEKFLSNLDSFFQKKDIEGFSGLGRETKLYLNPRSFEYYRGYSDPLQAICYIPEAREIVGELTIQEVLDLQ